VPVVGIDFGTSHTVAALRDAGGRVRPLLFDSGPLLASGVYAGRDGEILVGRDADRTARIDPAGFEPNPKRRIDEPTVLLGAGEYRLDELIGAVLRRVMQEAGRVAGGPVTHVVLTHPTGWGATRRQVLLDAAGRAGLTGVTLCEEAVAAGRYFADVLGHRVPDGQTLVVYDFGGGTFDVSVLVREGDDWRVLDSDGLTDVGGVDLDAALVEHVGRGLPAEAREPWHRLLHSPGTEERRQRLTLWDDVRAAKEQLSRAGRAALHIPLAGLDVHVGREEFERLALPILERTVAVTERVVRRCGGTGRTAGVFLVGGSSRIPLAATLLHRRLGIAPTVLEQPELVVAQGSILGVVAADPQPAPEPAPEPVPVPQIQPAAAPRRRRWRPIAAVALAVAAAVAGALVYENRGGGAGTDPAATPTGLALFADPKVRAIAQPWLADLNLQTCHPVRTDGRQVVQCDGGAPAFCDPTCSFGTGGSVEHMRDYLATFTPAGYTIVNHGQLVRDGRPLGRYVMYSTAQALFTIEWTDEDNVVQGKITTWSLNYQSLVDAWTARLTPVTPQAG